MPEDLTEIAKSYSNFDHQMPDGIEDDLRAGGVFATHPAWDHYGMIWFEDDEFHEQVMRYSSHVATISGETVKQVVDAVNEVFGNG